MTGTFYMNPADATRHKAEAVMQQSIDAKKRGDEALAARLYQESVALLKLVILSGPAPRCKETGDLFE